jgi:protein-disulfide isomerase
MLTPIPNRASGVRLGDPQAKASIEVFIDLQCPHSKASWPTLMALLKHYQNQAVSLTVHMITLSNHRQAWDMSLGALAYADGDAQKFFDFVTALYERQGQFYNSEYRLKTHSDLQQHIAQLANELNGYEVESFIARMNADDIYILGRTPIRYAATKGVWATPSFFVNFGSQVTVDHLSDLSAWAEMIDPLLTD